MFQFRHGHTVGWLNQVEVEKRPIYPDIGKIRERVGDLRAEWMLKPRNLVVFPNMQIADATALLLRTFCPLAPDRTEMRVRCLAPIGEPPEQRAWRLRQFEDFFNASGFATPDDTTVYEDCQTGYAARPLEWLQGYARGMATVKRLERMRTRLGCPITWIGRVTAGRKVRLLDADGRTLRVPAAGFDHFRSHA